MQSKPKIAKVLIETPLPQLDHTFDYNIPDDLLNLAVIGARVKVPFRYQQNYVYGFIIEITDKSDYLGELSSISDIIQGFELLPTELAVNARAVADRSVGSVSDVLRLVIPKRSIKKEQAYLAKHNFAVNNTCEECQKNKPFLVTEDTAVEINKLINEYDSVVYANNLNNRKSILAQAKPYRLSNGATVTHAFVTIASLAVKFLLKENENTRSLTHIEGLDLENNRASSLIIVPDYRDIEQLVTIFSSWSLDSKIVRLDSKISAAKKYEAYLRIIHEDNIIVIGNRSSVFAPVKNLGRIILWSDSDSSYQEPHSPYFHARDVALIRNEKYQTDLYFFDYTRSLAMARLIKFKWFEEYKPKKIFKPKIILTQKQDTVKTVDVPVRIPSFAWQQARALSIKGPVLIQVAKPGFANVVACEKCYHAARCLECAGPLHAPTAGIVRCRWQAHPANKWYCIECGNNTYHLLGSGSERTAKQFKQSFPNVPVIIADGNNIRTFVDSRPSIIVATRGAEPIAAGGYEAIILLDIDNMLARESLDAGEDLMRTVSHTSALAKIDAPIIITGYLEQEAKYIANWDFSSWANKEIIDRQTLQLPPTVRVFTVYGKDELVRKAVDKVISQNIASEKAKKYSDDALLSAVLLTCEYKNSLKVANELKAEIMFSSITNRKYIPKEKRSRKNYSVEAIKNSLRVHADDLGFFEQLRLE